MPWAACSVDRFSPTANSRPSTARRATGMPAMPRSSYRARRLLSPDRSAPATRSSIPPSNSRMVQRSRSDRSTRPAGADHVVMFEHVHHDADSETIRLREGRAEKHPPQPGENIVQAGAEARKGDIVLYAGTRLVPAHIAAAAACGAASVHVYAPPRVSILASAMSWSILRPHRCPTRFATPTATRWPPW